MKMTDKYIQARKSHLHYYRNVPLFAHNKDGEYVLYKKPGINLADVRINQELHPDIFYIQKKDKLAGIREVQTAFNKQLEENITILLEIKNALMLSKKEGLYYVYM